MFIEFLIKAFSLEDLDNNPSYIASVGILLDFNTSNWLTTKNTIGRRILSLFINAPLFIYIWIAIIISQSISHIYYYLIRLIYKFDLDLEEYDRKGDLNLALIEKFCKENNIKYKPIHTLFTHELLLWEIRKNREKWVMSFKKEEDLMAVKLACL